MVAEPDFCIKIDFEKNSEKPERLFKSILGLIESFQYLDLHLAGSISEKISPVTMLEDVEASSLKTWLRQVVSKIDDNALKAFDWRPIVGKFLVEAKYLAINFLDGKEKIEKKEEIEELSDHLHALAEKTDLRYLPAYKKVKAYDLLRSFQMVSESLGHLAPNDIAVYLYPDGEAVFNKKLSITEENIEELLTKETIRSSQIMLLTVKKPDYLGYSQWEFRHDKKPIDAKILDEQWLKKFQNRQITIRPGDAIKADVEIETKYDFNGEMIGARYAITHVLSIIHKDQQLNLPFE